MATVEDSPLHSIYLHELYWLSTNIARHCRWVFREASVPDEGGYIKVSQDLHARINAILRDAANIKKLLLTSERKFKHESQRQYRFRQARSRVLSDIVSGLDLSEILNSKVRNSIEHFDEYIDEVNLNLLDSDQPPASMAVYNVTISHWGVFEGRKPIPLRLYVADERRFHNTRYSIDIGLIAGEAVQLLEALKDRGMAPTTDEGPGGLIIPLGRES